MSDKIPDEEPQEEAAKPTPAEGPHWTFVIMITSVLIMSLFQIAGFLDSTFGPNDPITNEQFEDDNSQVIDQIILYGEDNEVTSVDLMLGSRPADAVVEWSSSTWDSVRELDADNDQYEVMPLIQEETTVSFDDAGLGYEPTATVILRFHYDDVQPVDEVWPDAQELVDVLVADGVVA